MLTIVDALSTDDLLVQAAEEASELVQALTKYYRAMHGTNPTPITVAEARKSLIEEIADVNVAVEAVRLKLGISCDDIAEVEVAKIERWERRLENGI